MEIFFVVSADIHISYMPPDVWSPTTQDEDAWKELHNWLSKNLISGSCVTFVRYMEDFIHSRLSSNQQMMPPAIRGVSLMRFHVKCTEQQIAEADGRITSEVSLNSVYLNLLVLYIFDELFQWMSDGEPGRPPRERKFNALVHYNIGTNVYFPIEFPNEHDAVEFRLRFFDIIEEPDIFKVDNALTQDSPYMPLFFSYDNY